MTTPETTAVAVTQPKSAMAKLLEPRAETLANLLPKGLDVNRVIAAATLAAHQNPALLKCDPASIFLSVGRIAQWGLQVGTTAYLVPFGTTCTAVKGYGGVIELITRSGSARTVRPGIHREGDFFEMEEGTEPRIRHRAAPGNKGAILGFYAVAHHGRDVPPSFKYMTVDEVEAHRKEFSKQHKSGPLKPWYGIKTVVIALGKYLVQNPDANLALGQDDDSVTEGAFEFPAPLSEAEMDMTGNGQPRFPRPVLHGDYPTVPEAVEDFDPTTGELR